MASFEKKLSSLLDEATKQNIITTQHKDALNNFVSSGQWEHKGWLSLSSAMGSLGALVLGFGIILIIASNWYALGDTGKFIGFLMLLVGSHAAGFALEKRGYSKLSASVHFLGAGLFIAGVGLVAQIFNLHSSKGVSFLIWAAMIAPLAYSLRNGAIALLSIIAFYIWGISYIDYISSWGHEWLSVLLFSCSLVFTTLIGAMLLRVKGSDMADKLSAPAAICMMGWLYVLGFTHEWGSFGLGGDGIQHPILLLLPISVLALGVIGWGWLFRASVNNRDQRMLLLALSTFVVTIIVMGFMLSSGFDAEDYTERNAFGRYDRLYIMPLFVSISAWISYFAIAFWGAIHGALHHKRWMLNGCVFLIGAGIFTRFMDLIGSMMDTGFAFIICGIVLLLIGYKLEKWRKKLIQQGVAA